MGWNISSEEYRDFITAMMQEYPSQEQFFPALFDEIRPLADKLGLASIKGHLHAPDHSVFAQDIEQDLDIYESGCTETGEVLTYQYITGEGGRFALWITPKTDADLSEEGQKNIRLLADSIFFVAGKARMGELLRASKLRDAMTGVSNHAGIISFYVRVRKENRIKDYTAAFINLKNFKYINQKFGMSCGNAILVGFCKYMVSLQHEDEMFARLGGDNFMLIVHHQYMPEIEKLMNHIVITVEYFGQQIPVVLEARMGIYRIRPEDPNYGEIMDNSSAALGWARHPQAPDHVWFEPHMREREYQEKEAAVLLPDAIRADEFQIYYQPKVRFSDETLCGAEALVRWYHGGRIVMPMEFIPALERDASICTLDFHVFEKVCKDIARWKKEGIEPVCTSVNFSKHHLIADNFADQILDTMAKYHVDSRYIEIELTEMAAMEDYNRLVTFVERMNENGVFVSIDDFGTGYSSLNLLKDLNVDVIKFDRSFIRSLDNHRQKDEIVIRNIIGMVNELNMITVAEGVETREQVAFLKEANCTVAQGYLYDRPLPVQEYEIRMKDRAYYHTARIPEAEQ